MNMKPIWFAAVALVVCFLVLSACGSKEEFQYEDKSGGNCAYVDPGDPDYEAMGCDR